jgi:hypothetical protein
LIAATPGEWPLCEKSAVTPRKKARKRMSVEEAMERHGFRIAASCAGKASYTKWVKHKGARAYVTVTDMSEDGLPNSLDEPVRVGIYELRSGDELEPSQDISSLRSYLESLDEQ